jgi:hypothetical protein
MDPSRPPLVVAFELSQKRKAIVADALAGASAVVYLTELDETARTEALRNTGVLLTFNTSEELQPGEAKLLNSARLIQFEGLRKSRMGAVEHAFEYWRRRHLERTDRRRRSSLPQVEVRGLTRHSWPPALVFSDLVVLRV